MPDILQGLMEAVDDAVYGPPKPGEPHAEVAPAGQAVAGVPHAEYEPELEF